MTNALARPRLPLGDGFSYGLYGFELTSGPPSPTGVEEWASSPSELYYAESAEAVAMAQTMSFRTESPRPTSALAWRPTLGDWYAGAPYYWVIYPGTQWLVTLDHKQAYALRFRVRAGSMTNAQTLVASTNGHDFPPVVLPPVGDFQDIVYHVPAEVACEGQQAFSFAGPPFSIEEVTFTPIITACYRWEAVKQGIVFEGFTDTLEISSEEGTTNSLESVEAFAASIGVSGSYTFDGWLAQVSAELNASYTVSGYTGTTVQFTQSTTVTSTHEVTVPEGALSVTYQYWQPVLVFRSDRARIDQFSARNLIPRRFVELPPLSPNPA